MTALSASQNKSPALPETADLQHQIYYCEPAPSVSAKDVKGNCFKIHFEDKLVLFEKISSVPERLKVRPEFEKIPIKLAL